MNISNRVALNFKHLSQLLSDKNLTKKASLNALAAMLDYGGRLLVGFIITPILLGGLGDFYFGVWQVLMRLIGYLSPASGRPTQALKMTLANQQTITDYDLKRRHVGSALAVWALFLPIMSVLGGLLAWFAPYWINAPQEYVWQIRLAAGLLAVNLILTNLAAIPQSVLEGENLGYKRMGLSTALIFVGGGFTWLALYLNTGITGVAVASIAITTVTGLFWLQVAFSFAPWFGVVKPSLKAVRDFLGLSWWFMGWNLIMNLMTASDVILLGMLASVESVTSYSLTKYAPETLINLVAIMTFGIAPGLGGIIGSGKFDWAAKVRGEIMMFTWMVITVFGSTVLLWNRFFLKLWVGEKQYVGTLPSLLIIVVVAQFVLIRNDSNFIDLTLKLQQKVILGALSVALSLSSAAILLGYFKLGVAGLCLGIILGRFCLSIGYPSLVGRYLQIGFVAQLKSTLRPALITILLFTAITWLNRSSFYLRLSPGFGWIELILSIGITVFIVLLVAFFLGLTLNQRKLMIRRVSIILGSPRSLS